MDYTSNSIKSFQTGKNTKYSAIETFDLELEEFKSYMEHKTIWKDIVEKDQILNGIEIDACHTISTYHYWTKRNMLFIQNTNDIIFISGSFIIKYSLKSSKMKMFPIKNNTIVTSMFTTQNIQGENLVIIGQKTKTNKKDSFEYFPKAEIIQIDFPDRENIFIDFSYYNCTNYTILDCIILPDSEICLTLLKSTDNNNHNSSKIIVWEYTSNSYLQSININEGIDSIYGINYHHFIIWGNLHCEFWIFSSHKKKIEKHKTLVELENNDDIITGFSVWKHGYIIALSTFLLIVLDINLNELYRLSVEKSVSNFSDNLVSLKSKYSAFIRNMIYINKLDTLFFFIQGREDVIYVKFIYNEKSADEEGKNQKQSINSINKNELKLDNDTNKESTGNKNRNSSMNQSKSQIQFSKTSITNIDLKVVKVESMEEQFSSKSIAIMNFEENLLITIIGEANSTAFLSLFKNKEKNVKSQVNLNKITNQSTVDFQSIKIRYLIHKIIHDNIHTAIDVILNNTSKDFNEEKNNKLSMISSKEENVKFNESHKQDYKLIVKLKELFPNSNNGHLITNICYSICPRLLVVCYENKRLQIFKQFNYETNQFIDNMKPVSQVNEEESEGNSNKVFFEFLFDFKLEFKPISISISPYGNALVISYPEFTYIYGLLNNELKEYVKLNSCSKGVAFSETGKYVAMSRSQFVNSNYSIVVLSTISWEIEYVISNISHFASIMKFTYNDSLLLAILEDNNIFGWKLEKTRDIVQPSSLKDKENSKNKGLKDPNIYIKNLEVTEKLLDFDYDLFLDTLVLATDENKIKLYLGKQEDYFFEFVTEEKYICILIVKKFDCVLFGTEEGNIKCYIWPLSKFYTGKTFIENPTHLTYKIHMNKVIQLYMTNDNNYLLSASEDGSIIISSITIFNEGEKVNSKAFYYFDSLNILPQTTYLNYSYFTTISAYSHKEKNIIISSTNNDIFTKINEFSSTIEKQTSDDVKVIEQTKEDMNFAINQERDKVKEKEKIKEEISKKLKEYKDRDINEFVKLKEELAEKHKIEKQEFQKETKKLTNLINSIREKYKNDEEKISSCREIVNMYFLDSMDKILIGLEEKEKQVEIHLGKTKAKYQKELMDLEQAYENKLKEIEFSGKTEEEVNREKLIRLDNSIRQTKKKVKDYNEKIDEWQKRKFELDQNNKELQENLAANIVRLKNMSSLLNDNEKNISDQERIVKKKREINARLEKLRYVLEYQITNLIKEKNPIEEQIKNFEELHNDFYQRFNLLYSEQLNIKDAIELNKNNINKFKGELKRKKDTLYILKNKYNSINLKLNFIFKDKMKDKYTILKKLEEIYNEFLDQLEDTHKNEVTNEDKIQTKILEKEIKKQKNKVLSDLISKRKEIKGVNREKLDLMQSIQKENSLFIEQCTSIRLNLNDILKNISDIEKKFIELTNTHSYLNQDNKTKLIKEDLKTAKKTILLADSESGKKDRYSSSVNKLSSKKLINQDMNGQNNMNSNDDLKINDIHVDKITKRIKSVLGMDDKYTNKDKQTHGFAKINELKLNNENENNEIGKKKMKDIKEKINITISKNK